MAIQSPLRYFSVICVSLQTRIESWNLKKTMIYTIISLMIALTLTGGYTKIPYLSVLIDLKQKSGCFLSYQD